MFLDSLVERAALFQHVYGDIQAMCQEAGCELQVVDLNCNHAPDDNSLRHNTKLLLNDLLDRDKNIIVTVRHILYIAEIGKEGAHAT